MKVARSVLVGLAALALSVSFAVPAEDLPETAYDESETLPYENTPLFSSTQQESSRLPRPALRLELPLRFHPQARRRILAEWAERTPHPICDSVVVLDHLLRC